MNIKEQCREIHRQVQELQAQLEYIKTTCPHTDVIVNKSITYLGDPFYRESHKCKECGKFWIETNEINSI